ncbi:hypothetical protein L2X99_14460 [Microbacterium sp. KUDC0406]|uniref:hypothetical protein n=1 Tax=Microbacterium sp. KUDC0406 TaxID=2909588 RepID=UPI001F2D7A23|nr:hypothetical protein [Microbacterium sp. KUDC0406]UJP09606.1 hypothetical protein L2X99_14460 [Microbacterium sp. KUDC0406]
MKRHLWRRALVVAALALVAVGLLLYVLAGIFDWTALSTGIGTAIPWAIAAFIGLGLLLRSVLSTGFRRRDLEGVGEPINDLYLGRVSSPPVAKSVDEHSAFPPPDDNGR